MASLNNSHESNSSLQTLPPEIQLAIFGSLLPQDIASLTQTNSHLHRLVQTNTQDIAKTILATQCPALVLAVPRPTTCTAWEHPEIPPGSQPLLAPRSTCENPHCAILMNAILFTTARHAARTHWLARNLDFFTVPIAQWNRLSSSPAAYARFLLASLGPALDAHHRCQRTPHFAPCARMTLLSVSARDSLAPLHLHWALPAPFVPARDAELAERRGRHGAALERVAAEECDRLDSELARVYGVHRYRHLSNADAKSVYAEPRAACCRPCEPGGTPDVVCQRLTTYEKNHPKPGEHVVARDEKGLVSWMMN